MRHLIVGVDGSAESLAALSWAASVVGAHGTVHAVHVVEGDDTPYHRSEAADRLEAWVATLPNRTSPNVTATNLTRTVAGGGVAKALVEVASAAPGQRAIVVGPHGQSTTLPRRLGSVTAELLRTASCPVIVVREPADGPLPPGGTIVVAAGQDDATRAALSWAAQVAQERSMAMSLIDASGHRPVFTAEGLIDLLADYIDAGAIRKWAEEDLASLAAEVRRTTGPELQVTWSAPSGAPGPRLVRAASSAALLVVGSAHDGPLSRRFTVPTLHHVLTHAPCPVAVVPASSVDAAVLPAAEPTAAESAAERTAAEPAA